MRISKAEKELKEKRSKLKEYLIQMDILDVKVLNKGINFLYDFGIKKDGVTISIYLGSNFSLDEEKCKNASKAILKYFEDTDAHDRRVEEVKKFFLNCGYTIPKEILLREVGNHKLKIQSILLEAGYFAHVESIKFLEKKFQELGRV